jgi:hypothetical protein
MGREYGVIRDNRAQTGEQVVKTMWRPHTIEPPTTEPDFLLCEVCPLRRRRVRRILVVLVILVVGVTWVYAESPSKSKPSKTARLEVLAELQGIPEMWGGIIQRILENGRRQNPQAPERIWDDLSKEVSESKSRLVAEYISLLENRFSEEEIDQLITVFRTSLGKKMRQLLVQVPEVMEQLRASSGQLTKAQINQRMESIYEEYESNLTAYETSTLETFLASPAGKKYQEITPVTEAMGIEYGKRFRQTIVEKLTKGGYHIKGSF